MKTWDAPIEEDHQALMAQAGALEAALAVDLLVRNRWVVLSWTVKGLHPSLELHLRKEEEAFFPALERVMGKDAASVTLLKEQHHELRAALRHLAELIQDPESLNWNVIGLAVEAFVDLLEDHERKEEKLLIHVLGKNLRPKVLAGLTEGFQQVAQRAYVEEGWPRRDFEGGLS